MGNLCCCFKKSYYDDEYNSETRRILDNPVGINDGAGDRRDSHYASSMVSNNTAHGGYGSTQVNGTRQAYENNQNQLYQNVLDRLQSRVIDISSIEKSCEQADLTDREQAYYEKLSNIRKTVVINSNNSVLTLRSDYPLKTQNPIDMEDYKLITDIAIKSSSAVNFGFRIHSDDPFVVNFDS